MTWNTKMGKWNFSLSLSRKKNRIWKCKNGNAATDLIADDAVVVIPSLELAKRPSARLFRSVSGRTLVDESDAGGGRRRRRRRRGRRRRRARRRARRRRRAVGQRRQRHRSGGGGRFRDGRVRFRQRFRPSSSLKVSNFTSNIRSIQLINYHSINLYY